ncbi:hypothetical protein ACTSKR_09490 [Chitinibacteraceae bacterium HSL-7]
MKAATVVIALTSLLAVAGIADSFLARSELAQIKQAHSNTQVSLQLAEERASNLEAQLRKMPIVVKTRRAIFGSGKVAVFSTTIKRDIPIQAIFQSTSGQSISKQLLVPQVGYIEVGHLEGVTLAPGDSITLENEQYDSLTVSIQE